MPRLSTPVTGPAPFSIGTGSRIMVLGSCFADAVGRRLAAAGFNVLCNPFGTLYNPLSICSAVRRLHDEVPFTEKDCVRMGAGVDLVCSFSHHTSFARPGAGDFLANANARLAEACAFWRECDTVLITFGTAKVWTRAGDGSVVANCLKRPASEFVRRSLSVGDMDCIAATVLSCGIGKRYLFTVSPIRHLGDGAHENSISKATLLLGTDLAVSRLQEAGVEATYFPAYEIVLDELRDYRFYAEDLCHPSPTAEEIVWERFLETFVPEADLKAVQENEKAARRAAHRPIH